MEWVYPSAASAVSENAANSTQSVSTTDKSLFVFIVFSSFLILFQVRRKRQQAKESSFFNCGNVYSHAEMPKPPKPFNEIADLFNEF